MKNMRMSANDLHAKRDLDKLADVINSTNGTPSFFSANEITSSEFDSRCGIRALFKILFKLCKFEFCIRNLAATKRNLVFFSPNIKKINSLATRKIH